MTRTGPDFDMAQRALLPDGFRDQLFPDAELAARIVAGFHQTVLSEGYDLVSPPLVEYEASVLAGPGKTADRQMFRVMDTETQKIMALRSDMTAQMARIAGTRLVDEARPLRLAYAGEIARVKGSMLRPNRQFLQAGIELVGPDSLDADLEVITVMIETLSALGIPHLTVDLTCAPLIDALIQGLDLTDPVRVSLAQALETKDLGTLQAMVLEDVRLDVFVTLLESVKERTAALKVLKNLTLSGEAAAFLERLIALAEALETVLPDVQVTIDACERKGFAYKTGVGFAVFAKGGAGELGRGGRYRVTRSDGSFEDANGFSLYGDRLADVLRTSETISDGSRRLYIIGNLDAKASAALKAEGYRLVRELGGSGDYQAFVRECKYQSASKGARRGLFETRSVHPGEMKWAMWS